MPAPAARCPLLLRRHPAPPPPRCPQPVLLLLRHAACLRSRGEQERERRAVAGVRRTAALRRRNAAAGGAAGSRDVRLPRPSIRFGRLPRNRPFFTSFLRLPHSVSLTAISSNTWRAVLCCSTKREEYIKEGFKRAFSAPWPKTLRYQRRSTEAADKATRRWPLGDGRPFWRIVVAEATDCTDNDCFEEVYQYYAHGDSWCLPVGAYRTLRDLKDAGVKLAVVSNFNTRLRKLLKDLNVSDMFDAIVVSSEVGYEKPAPVIFKIALDQIGVEASKAVHVGDDGFADKTGANAIGLECWLWGEDVKTFSDIRGRIIARDPQ